MGSAGQQKNKNPMFSWVLLWVAHLNPHPMYLENIPISITDGKNRADPNRNQLTITYTSAEAIFSEITNKIKYLVEAVGFEPTSENHQPEAHTCLSPRLDLASSGASGKAPESASPVHLIFPPRTMSERPAWFLTSLRLFRRRPRNALA